MTEKSPENPVDGRTDGQTDWQTATKPIVPPGFTSRGLITTKYNTDWTFELISSDFLHILVIARGWHLLFLKSRVNFKATCLALLLNPVNKMRQEPWLNFVQIHLLVMTRRLHILFSRSQDSIDNVRSEIHNLELYLSVTKRCWFCDS